MHAAGPTVEHEQVISCVSSAVHHAPDGLYGVSVHDHPIDLNPSSAQRLSLTENLMRELCS